MYLANPYVTQPSLAQAISSWRRAIGDAGVITDASSYNIDTSNFSGQILAALRPIRTEQVQHVLKIAQRYSIPIHPISTGRNWGYGTSVPVRSPCAILDLSSMNKIIEFDVESGVVTLEPGVTQGDLSQFLRSRKLPFMVPVTGAGPLCSVLGNALERGFGVTPVTDHFGAIISMKVVLPDGEIYESYTRTYKSAGVSRAYKWGTGPYLDGLFSQSNLGIVVDASIALQARPERSGALFFELDDVDGVEEATGHIKELLNDAGHNIGAINVMSRSRIECLMSGSRNAAASPRRSLTVPDRAWFCFGSLYGSEEHYRATRALVKRRLRGHVRKIRIYDSADLKRLRWLSAFTNMIGWPHLEGLVERLQAVIDVVDGVPSTVALPLAYAKSGRARNVGDLNPARDGCGLFWYSPIVPMRRGVVGQFIEFAERTCAKHGLPAAITLTTLSPRCYACTLPLLFDRMNPDAEREARICFEELCEEGSVMGFMPYRIGAQFMHVLTDDGAALALRAIKRALDPNHLLAPGRYTFE